MRGTANTSSEGSYCGRAVRGVSNLSHEDFCQIEAHRAKDRPTPWAHLAARYGVNEIDLRRLLDPRKDDGDDRPAPLPVARNRRADREARFRSLWTNGVPKSEIISIMGISSTTLDTLRLKLGLPKRAVGAKPNGWTADEDDYIRTHYVILGQSAVVVAAALGRTRNGIIGRAHRQGWTRKSLRGLAA